MRLYEKRRRRRRRQKVVISSIFAILTLSLTFLLIVRAERPNDAPGEPTGMPCEVIVSVTEAVQPVFTEPQPQPTEIIALAPDYPEFAYSKDWDADDGYLLAKIAMAEAEGESTEGKSLVIMVVLNRVWSKDFPNTIKDVIFQKNQFSPISNGRWGRVEPDADCYAALEMVMTSRYDYSGGALYFESSEDADNWHSRNLEFLYQNGHHKFYK